MLFKGETEQTKTDQSDMPCLKPSDEIFSQILTSVVCQFVALSKGRDYSDKLKLYSNTEFGMNQTLTYKLDKSS